jgi:UDP:flavonoid glycosyltransferase YjiC (YdhE family)
VPAWLTEPGDPWVLVTCSTDYQRDEALAQTAVEALRDEPVRVLLTLADAYDTIELPSAANVRATPNASRMPPRSSAPSRHPRGSSRLPSA